MEGWQHAVTMSDHSAITVWHGLTWYVLCHTITLGSHNQSGFARCTKSGTGTKSYMYIGRCDLEGYNFAGAGVGMRNSS